MDISAINNKVDTIYSIKYDSISATWFEVNQKRQTAAYELADLILKTYENNHKNMTFCTDS